MFFFSSCAMIPSLRFQTAVLFLLSLLISQVYTFCTKLSEELCNYISLWTGIKQQHWWIGTSSKAPTRCTQVNSSGVSNPVIAPGKTVVRCGNALSCFCLLLARLHEAWWSEEWSLFSMLIYFLAFASKKEWGQTFNEDKLLLIFRRFFLSSIVRLFGAVLVSKIEKGTNLS